MENGERMRTLRKEKGLKQEDLAKLAGISRVAVGNYERGDRFPPVHIAAKLAEALGVSMDYLYPTRNDPDLEAPPEYKGIVGELSYSPEGLKGAIIEDFDTLNHTGQKEAQKRVHELTQIPDYQKDK